MKYLRAFIAGLVFPAVVTPFVFCLTNYLGKPQFSQISLILWLPIIWGLWNVLYLYAGQEKYLPKDQNISYLGAGALLGLLLALYGIFIADLPSIMGLGNYKYLPLIGAPVLYALIWRFVVKPLNELIVR